MMISVLRHGKNDFQFVLYDTCETGNILWASDTFEIKEDCSFNLMDAEKLLDRFKPDTSSQVEADSLTS